MQQAKGHLTDVNELTFGQTASERRSIASAILAAGVLFCLAFQVTGHRYLLALGIPSAVFALITLINLTFRNSLQINFSRGVYYIETGSWPAIKVTGGSLSEIHRLILTRDLHFSCFDHAAFLEFHPAANREPYRLDILPCAVTVRDYPERVALYLELAEHLNVPLYDDSGWNGSRPLITDPEVIIIQPGEEHPVLKRLQKPKKWNKW